MVEIRELSHNKLILLIQLGWFYVLVPDVKRENEKMSKLTAINGRCATVLPQIGILFNAAAADNGIGSQATPTGPLVCPNPPTLA